MQWGSMTQWLFLGILLVVAWVQFITQQLLGNPLSSPPYKCPYQQSWVAASQQNPANPFLLWGWDDSSKDEETSEEHNFKEGEKRRLLQMEQCRERSPPQVEEDGSGCWGRWKRVKRKKVRITAERIHTISSIVNCSELESSRKTQVPLQIIANLKTESSAGFSLNIHKF